MRHYLAVLGGTFIVILSSLLAGFLPLPIAMWLPLIGFFLGCIVIGAGGQFRVAQAVIITLALYIGAIMLVSLIEFMSPLILGPLNLGLIADAWIEFRDTIFGLIPPLQLFLFLADTVSFFILDQISHDFIYNLVSFSFFALFGLLFAGLPAYIIDRRSFAAPTTPRVSSTSEPSFSELMEKEFQPTDQKSASSTATMPPPPRTTATQSPSVPPPPQSSFTPPPPTRSPPRSTKSSSSSSSSPTAQAIMREGGKVMKRLKSTGQKAPAGQSRCPYCNETVVRGSSFCNACQRKIG